jgi:hypothetical protein
VLIACNKVKDSEAKLAAAATPKAKKDAATTLSRVQQELQRVLNKEIFISKVFAVADVAHARALDFVVVQNDQGYLGHALLRPATTMTAKVYGVLEMVGENACRVDIPNDWRIWPVISLRNLTKAPDGPDPYSRIGTTLGKPTEPDKEPEIDWDSRFYKGKHEYWVKWQGLPLSRCSWEVPSALDKWKDLVDEFEKSRQKEGTGKRTRVGTVVGTTAKRAK